MGVTGERRFIARPLLNSLLIAAGCWVVLSAAQAAPVTPAPPTSQPAIGMAELLQEVITGHERILKAQAKLDAAKHRTREAMGGWFPELDLNTSTGSERDTKEGIVESSLHYHELDLKLTQPLWDFGKIGGKVRKAAQGLEKAKAGYDSAIIRLLLDGAKASLNVIKHREALQLAKKAEQNILVQTNLEKNLIAAGAGLGTDLLQAKAQHAAAETRSIRAEGALIKAENEFRKLFKREPNPAFSMESLNVHLNAIQPKDLQEALQTAHLHNTEMRTARIDLQMARDDVDQIRGEKYFPSLNFEAEHKWQDNVAGVEGRKNVLTTGFKLNMPLNLGMTAIDTVNAQRQELLATEHQLTETSQTTEEEVRNAWQELITLRAIAITLDRQAEISEGFLELARQERKLGNRSLLDVLSGETSLINAQSDAASAKIDVLIGMIALLKSTGQLKLEMFTDQPPLSR